MNERRVFIGEYEVDFMSLQPNDKFILCEEDKKFVGIYKVIGYPLISDGVEGVEVLDISEGVK